MPALAEVLPFSHSTMDSIEKRNQGSPWLLVIWSTDCPPCYEELDTLARLKKQRQDRLRIELVSSDPDTVSGDVKRVLKTYQLDHLDTWQYTEANRARIQHSIDEKWRGELPRSYFYKPDGSRCGISGLLSEAVITAWFDAGQFSCGLTENETR